MGNHERTQSLAADLLRGLIYAHNRANANTAAAHEANSALRALVDLLVEQGMVDRETFEARRAQSSEQLRRDYVERGMAVAMQEFSVSKYDFKGGAEIDCGSRVHLCKSACCRLPLALSKEDVQEGVVKWDLGQPYMNARDADGYCSHFDRCSNGCTVYSHRPIPCRGYDCREDKRIWVDFENRVINPTVGDADWPGCLKAVDAATSESGHISKVGQGGIRDVVEDPKAKTEFRDAAKKDGCARVSPYAEKTWEEFFAGSFALYITDPETLKRLGPNIFQFFEKLVSTTSRAASGGNK